MEDQIYTIWLPLIITVVFAVVGMMRGVLREAIVAASVVLAGFINLQWGENWSQGLKDMFPDIDKGQGQFFLSLIVLWLIVPVVGYGLSTLLPKQETDSRSWIGGMLMGLASGAAVVGLTLRYAYSGLDGMEESSRFYQNLLSRGFMVWAGWFPLLLAFLGALFVLLVPIRRAQKAVARPSNASNWGPSGRPGALPPQTPAPAMASSLFPPPVAASPGVGGVPPYPPAPPQYSTSPQEAKMAPAQNAPASSLLSVGSFEEFYSGSRGANPSEAEPSMTTRTFNVVTPPEPASREDRGQSSGDGSDTDTYSAFHTTGGNDSSWLLQSIEDNQKQTEDSEVGGLSTTTSFQTEHALATQSTPSAPPVIPMSTGEPAQDAVAIASEKRCSNCSAPAMPGAFFCTECGTRIA